MKLGRPDYHALGHVAALTFDNPRGHSQKQKPRPGKARARAAGKRTRHARKASRR